MYNKARNALIVVCIAAAACPAAGSAQEAGTIHKRDDRLAITSGGPLSRTTANESKTEDGEDTLLPTFQISSVDNNVVGEFALTWSGGNVEAIKVDSQVIEIGFSRTDVSLKASVPFNATEGDNPFINFSNVGNDAQVSFEFLRRSGTDRTSPQRYDYLAILVGRCLTDVSEEWLAERSLVQTSDREAVDSVIAAYRIARASGKQLGSNVSTQIDKEIGKAENAFWQAKSNACRITGSGPIRNQEDLIARYDPSGSLVPDGADIGDDGVIFLRGFSASAGYQKFEVLNRSAFRLDTSDRVGFELEAFAGFISGNGSISGRLTGAYVRSFQAQDEVEFCRDVSTQTQECLTGSNLLPTRTDSIVLKAEGRVVLNRDDLGRPNLAMAPEVSYNVDDNEWLFDLPIYLQRNEENGLDAGIRLAYGTKDSDFSAGLFVGVPFAGIF